MEGHPQRSTRFMRSEERLDAARLAIEGKTPEDIAEALDVPVYRILNVLRDIEQMHDAESLELAKILRTKQYIELQDLKDILAPGVEKGDLRVIDRYLKLLAREAKLMGLDAPERIAHEGEIGVHVDLGQVSDDVLRQLLTKGTT